MHETARTKRRLRLVAAVHLLASVGCDGVVDPSEHRIHEPSVAVAVEVKPAAMRLVDTLRTTADAGVQLLPYVAGDPSAFQVLLSPSGGTVEQRGSSLWYVPTAGVAGRDFVVVQEPPGASVEGSGVRIAMVRVAPAKAKWAGVRVVQQAARNDVSPRHAYVAADPSDPRIVALRPLVDSILADYGNPTSALDRARAVRDWLARVAVHPYWPLHPEGSTANLAVLPPGRTWEDVNRVGLERFDEDSRYWWQMWPDGISMLDRLLGTPDGVGGARAADGMLEHVAGSHYRIRDVDSYRYVLCSYQSRMLTALWAAIGLHGMMLPTQGHDASAVFIPELAKWVYMDPTYNEEYTFDGMDAPLSPSELMAYSTAGLAHRLTRRGIRGPEWSPDHYIVPEAHWAASYVGEHPDGFLIMGSQLNNAVTLPGGPDRQVQVDVPRLEGDRVFGDTHVFSRVPAAVAFPQLGVEVVHVESHADGHTVTLRSTFPYHVRYERRIEDEDWVPAGRVDVLPKFTQRVEYRSLDALGNTGMTAVLEIDACAEPRQACQRPDAF